MEVLGVDIGGSGIKGAPVNTESGELLAERHRIPTPNPSTPAKIAEKLVKLVDHFKWKGSIGCGFPAVIRDGIVRTAANIDSGWINTNINNLFSEATNCNTVTINDADAAGLAEMKFGGAKDLKNGVTIIITVGTGLGTSIFSNGVLLPNTELGHIFLNGKDAEKFASDAARKKYNLNWKKWAKRFNLYLNEMERLFWPDLIIIGGGASKKYDKFLDYISTQAKIIPAQLKNEAGIIGAALSTQI